MRGKRSEMPMPIVQRIKRKHLVDERPAPAVAEAVTDAVADAVTDPVTDAVTEVEWREADPAAGAAPEVHQSENISNKTNDRTGAGVGDEIARLPEHLAADMRDSMLALIKRQDAPWDKMPESQQAVFADEVFTACRAAVEDAVTAILETQPVHVDVRVDKIGIDKDIKVTLSAANVAANVSKLAGAWHKSGILVMLSPGDFTQWVKPETMPDQPGLDLQADQMEDA